MFEDVEKSLTKKTLISLQVEIDQDSLGDQFLPYFYAEDQMNAMNQERRREGLFDYFFIHQPCEGIFWRIARLRDWNFFTSYKALFRTSLKKFKNFRDFLMVGKATFFPTLND